MHTTFNAWGVPEPWPFTVDEELDAIGQELMLRWFIVDRSLG